MVRHTVTGALSIAFIAIAAIFVLYASFTLGEIQQVNGSASDVAENWIPRIMQSQALEVSLMRLSIAFKNALDADGHAARVNAETEITQRQGDVEAILSRFDDRQVSERATISELKALYAQYAALGGGLPQRRASGDETGARTIMDQIDTDAQRLVDMAREIGDRARAGADKAHRENASTYERIVVLSVAATIGAALFILLAAYYVVAWIARPIAAINGTMSRLARGDLRVALASTRRRDEIGTMTAAIEVFRQDALRKVQLKEQTRLQAECQDEERRELTERAERVARDTMLATSSIADGLRRVATGDLSFTVTDELAPEFERLRQDFNAAVRQLGDTLQQVSGSVHSIELGGRRISQSADALARRTEKQAAALVETAAVLDQITANFSSSSAKLRETSAIALRMTRDADRYSDAATQAISAMTRVEVASNRISTIIDVIEDVAFQTTLLALNAGVEAPRTDGASKGFTVSQEVGDLSQRSAESAQQVKDLIALLRHEVENGAQLACKTAKALGVISDEAKVANTNIEAIGTTTREQATALSEVNGAVSQVDQLIQQNAAMVLDANAASETLVSESQKLKQLVSQFRLPGDAAPRTKPNLRVVISA